MVRCVLRLECPLFGVEIEGSKDSKGSGFAGRIFDFEAEKLSSRVMMPDG